VIGWFIVNIQSDLLWHRCLERQAFCTPRKYTLSPSKSIKWSNYWEFLKDKNVLLCTRLFKYAPNLESLLTQQYVCVMCTLWSDNTCIFTHFHSEKKRKYAAYLELWYTKQTKFVDSLVKYRICTRNVLLCDRWRDRMKTENRKKRLTCRKSLANFIKYTSSWTVFELTMLVVIATDWTGSCKSNYHTIRTITDPTL
jgi:hypothetical protein